MRAKARRGAENHAGRRATVLAALGVVLAALTGCGVTSPAGAGLSSSLATGTSTTSTTTTTTTTAPEPSSIALTGKLHGGQNPISGGNIVLWAVSSTGDGASSVSIMNAGTTVSSAADGSFSLTGTFTCPTAPTYVYLTASGGNPGLVGTVNNTAIQLMDALGLCSNLIAPNPPEFILVNELTTVAAVAALYPFMSSYKAMGSTNSNASALATAMGVAAEYANTTTGSVPGTLPSNYTLATQTMISLADAIASCVSTSASNSSACSSLFTATETATGTKATDTVGSLINVMNYPTTPNGTAILTCAGSSGPYQPVYVQAPATWALPIVTGTTQQLSFGSGAYSVNESAGTVTLNVSRFNGSSGALSVNYATADGTDTTGSTPGNAVNGYTYTSSSGTLNWSAGDTTDKLITVPVTDQQVTSGSIIFTVALSSPSGAVLGMFPTATVTINLNDAAPVDFTVNSGVATVNSSSYTFALASNSFSVNENSTYTIGTTATVVPFTFGIERHGSVPAGTTYTLYYTEGAPAVPANGNGGASALPAAVGGSSCSGSGGPDYVTTTGSTTWTSSSPTTQYVTVPICDRGLTDGSTKVFLVQVSTTVGGPLMGENSYGIVTITENDSVAGTVGLAASTDTVSESAGVAELLVNRATGSTGVVTVSYATADGTAAAGTDYTATTGTLTWDAGDLTTKVIDVPITNEGLTTGTKAFTLNLSSITGGATLGTSSATVTIEDNDVSSSTVALSAGTYSVSENVGTATIPVVLTGASSGTVTVSYTTQDSTGYAGTDYTAASGTLTWTAGATGAQNISVPITNEYLSSGSRTFNVVLGTPTGTAMPGSPTSAIVTINDNDTAGTAGTLQFAGSSYTTSESSGSAQFSVTRTGNSTGAVTVHYGATGYTATAGTDYTATSGTLSWASGSTTTQTITVPLTDVHLYSGTRTFYMTLTSPTGGAVVGANASVPVTILENDAISYPTSDAFSNSVDVSYSDTTDPVTHQAVTFTWSQFPANDFGPDPVVYNTSTQLTAISALPAAGVHPRLLFTAADVPAMQCRLTGNNCTGSNTVTVSGALLYKKLQEYDAGLKGVYNDDAAYTVPDLLQGGYEGSHGNTYVRDYKDPSSLWYPGNHVYADLQAGIHPIDVASGAELDTTVIWPTFAYEALYCLINNDTTGMQNLLAAATNELTWEQAARTAANTATPYVATAGSGNAGFYFGYIYDWAYNSMTSAQVSQWTTELQNTSWAADNYGTLNAASASRSNWATFTYRTPQVLDLYGQTGYNDIKVAGLQRGMQNFMTYGIFPSGAYVEGEAKDQLGSEAIIMLTRAGFQNLFQHPNLQAYVHSFLPASVVPNPRYVDPGSVFPPGPFLRYDLLGGIEDIQNVDSVVLHYMFPNDNVVDWLYQLQQGSSYQYMTPGVGTAVTGNGAYFDDLLTSVAYMTDFNPANSDPATLGLPLTYFSGERALMMTRSDWSTNAMMLNMHTREFNGGHPMDDRNSIFLFAKGRAWSAVNQMDFNNTYQSIVNIDANASSPPIQSVTTPGRMVDFQDQTYATFSVGDASYCWDWTDTTSGNGYTPAEIAAGDFSPPSGSAYDTHSKNSFAYTKLVSDEMNAPVSALPSWIDYNGDISPVTRAALLPVVKAYRTTGLVRGASTGVTPYGLVVDDIEVSATTSHHYDWQMLLINDLQIVSEGPVAGSEGVYDITLAAGGVVNPGDPVLLIRVLDMNSTTNTAPYILPASTTNTRADAYRPMLIIPADSTAPNFKVLLFAYNQGDTLPTTTWTGTHAATEGVTSVTINMPTYTDVVTFSPAASGKTDINIVRGGQQILNMNTPIAPFQ